MDIEIPKDLAEAEGVPDDLDSTVAGPYHFVSPTRRTIAAKIYGVGAVAAGVGAVAGLPVGMWIVAALLAGLAVHHLMSAHAVEIDDSAALTIAGRLTESTVGHASAALRFEGPFARPVWNVLIYNADEPPTQRALVQIDAKSGELAREVYVEELLPPTG